jgi:hypothetical protein
MYDERDAVGLQHCRAEGLEHPRPNEPAEVRCESAESRAEHKNPKSIDVEKLAADHVGCASKGRHRGHEYQQVGQANPLHSRDRHAEVVGQTWQSQGDDARIKLPHESTETHCRDDVPIGIGPRRDR